jgi:hypothetical protein
MFTVTDFGTWLATLGITTPVADYYFLPPSPDQLVLVALSGGQGLMTEEAAIDRGSVNVRCRSLQRQPDTGSTLANQVDSALLAASFGVNLVGTTEVIAITRLGGPPTFAGTDEAYRSTYSASYQLTFRR